MLSSLARAGHRSAVVVPLLFTAAYHGRVDIPTAVAAAPLDVTVADVLGPVDGVVPPELLDALAARLWTLNRRATLDALQDVGLPAVEFRPDLPLDAALAPLARTGRHRATRR